MGKVQIKSGDKIDLVSKPKKEEETSNDANVVVNSQHNAICNEVLITTTKKRKRKKVNEEVNNLKKDKKIKKNKIIFDDNGQPQEVIHTNSETISINTETKGQVKKKLLNDDEAEVNDEDIDKFIDELDEEDNEQYEDWVKLVEAKLNSNKKSKT